MSDQVFDFEVIAPEGTLQALSLQLREVAVGDVATFQHRGRDGEAGMGGIISKIPMKELKRVWNTILALADKDKVRVVVGPVEIEARNVDSFQQVMNILADHGLVGSGGDD